MTYTVSGIAVYSVISEFMAGTKIDDVYKITGFQPFWAILFFVMLCSLFAFGERKKETDFVGLSFMVIIAVSVALFYNGTKCTIPPIIPAFVLECIGEGYLKKISKSSEDEDERGPQY